MVFQSYALYPHMSVESNMGFALRMQKQEKASIASRVASAGSRLGIGELMARRPRALSGGQRQRVALGRAIVRSPQAFLMDEPLSNLDAKLRVEMRAYIARLHQELGTTTLYVTHDQTEAMTMGDRVAVMRDGRLEQVDSPQRLYEQPQNMFVAGFIGSPAMNLLTGHLVADAGTGGGLTVRLGEQSLAVPPELLAERPALRAFADRPVIVGIRPEDMYDAADDDAPPPDGAVLRADTDLVESMGSEVHVHVRLSAPPAVTADVQELAEDVGAEDQVPDPGTGHSELVARLGPRTRVREGDSALLRVATDRMHFFDPETGLSVREES
jgi:multiple sugar transport system ATP-binding protein